MTASAAPTAHTTTSTDYLDELTAFVCSAQLADVTPRALQHLRYIVADTLAACAIGNQQPEMQAMLAQQLALSGAGQAAVLGTGAAGWSWTKAT